jgi:hypothetical protein
VGVEERRDRPGRLGGDTCLIGEASGTGLAGCALPASSALFFLALLSFTASCGGERLDPNTTRTTVKTFDCDGWDLGVSMGKILYPTELGMQSHAPDIAVRILANTCVSVAKIDHAEKMCQRFFAELRETITAVRHELAADEPSTLSRRSEDQ